MHHPRSDKELIRLNKISLLEISASFSAESITKTFTISLSKAFKKSEKVK